jgi:hypothetical protein
MAGGRISLNQMTLPSSESGGRVSAMVQPLPQMTPAATPSAINALFEAYKNGLIQADDIHDRLTIKPLQDQVKVASANDALDQIKVAPIRRQQEMSAAEQAAQLRDLQIKEGTNALSDYPATRDFSNRLRTAQIQKLETENKYIDPKEQAAVEDAKAQAALRKAQADAATTKGQPSPQARAMDTEHVNSITSKADQLINTVKGFSTGVVAATGRALNSHVPGSSMKDFNADLDSLKAELKTYNTSQMAAASKTGSIGFRVTSQREFDALGESIEALRADMSPQKLQENLQKVKDHVLRIEKLKADDGLTPVVPGAEGPTPAPKAPANPDNLPVVEPAQLDSFEGGAFVTPTGEKGYKPKIAPAKSAAPVPAPVAPAPVGATTEPAFATPPSPQPTALDSAFGSGARRSPAPHELILQDLKHDIERIKKALGIGTAAPAAGQRPPSCSNRRTDPC